MITFLIPTYNEYFNIDIIIKKIESLSLEDDYLIYFVDDNSDDGSLSKFINLKKNFNNVDYKIRKSSSKDLTKSIIYALDYINSEYVFVMDCDLQHDLKAIPIMINLIKSGNYDLVIGSRNIEKIKSFKRRYISFIGIWITKVIGIPRLIDPLSGFFIIKTKKFIKTKHKIKSKGYKVLLSLIFFLRSDIKIKEVIINFYPRKYGKSKFNILVVINFLIQIINLIFLRISDKK